MGKRDSYLFARMHDMKDSFPKDVENPEMTLISAYLPKVLEQFAMEHPEFPACDAILAMCGLFSLNTDEVRIKYRQQMEYYQGDALPALQDVLDNGEALVRIVDAELAENKRNALYVATLCAALRSKKDPEMRETACNFLDQVLYMEEQGADTEGRELVVFMGLAMLVDFEAWHDEKYGDPIVGKSNYDAIYGKNAQNQFKENMSSPRRRSAARELSATPVNTPAAQPRSVIPDNKEDDEKLKGDIMPSSGKEIKDKIISFASNHIIASYAIIVALFGILFGPTGVVFGLIIGGGSCFYLYRQNKQGGGKTMGLFGKKEDHYRVFVTFPGRVSLENTILATMFDACKRHGFGLGAEPTFDGHQDQTWVSYRFANNAYGHLTWFHSENKAMVDFTRPVDSQTTDEDVTAAVRDWLQTMSGQGIEFTFSAEKEGRRKYNYEKWDAVYPPRRTFM